MITANDKNVQWEPDFPASERRQRCPAESAHFLPFYSLKDTSEVQALTNELSRYMSNIYSFKRFITD